VTCIYIVAIDVESSLPSKRRSERFEFPPRKGRADGVAAIRGEALEIPLLRFVEVEDVVVELGTVQILDAKLPRACLPDSSIA
jgi:hypothetical protein